MIDETQTAAAFLEPGSVQTDRIASWPEISSPSPAQSLASRDDRYDDVTRYVPTELMDQADTRDYPDRSHAIDGVLYV
ncbi:hypothetical protein ASG84_08790 [Rhodococcus sp. Leaf278]|nr:hypothetical protein ASG84_08790 [Rhodococcus sp. Leaf278]